MFDISPIQILMVLAIALLVFGPSRLPEMGRSIGRGLREFRGSVSNFTDDLTAEPTPRPHAAAPSEPASPAALAEPPADPPAADPDAPAPATPASEDIIVPGDQR